MLQGIYWLFGTLAVPFRMSLTFDFIEEDPEPMKVS